MGHMRRAQKKQAEDFVNLLKQAHEEIRSQIEQGENGVAMDLLGQCQDGAIQLCDFIEKIEGEGTSSVFYLSEYYKKIYKVYEELGSGSAGNAGEVYEKLQASLEPARISIINDIKVKLEIVFLPYKASMWDSLESVWKAADADPDCSAYVVPIPYYDKNPDGSFGEMHYEGKMYPKYVPIIGYETFDFQHHRPDMIFIHNPYDQCNYITSVHPFFYSKNLKKYTDNLIYIPYFALGDTVYEQFCVEPGTLYADYVIVQSEKARQVYLKCLKKSTHLPDAILERKILALGSPKVDKVLNDNRSAHGMPTEWMRLLDGKKAVLYNTGVGGLLNGNSQSIKKIEDTIKVFKRKKDVVLWWRPHPLIESTIKAMRPQLYEQYAKIVRQYKEDGNGIYDDTPDLQRALMWSDMYYGDDSSLVYLYGIQGKPIVKQNIYVLTCAKDFRTDRSISFNISVYSEGRLWFAARNYNGLFELDMTTGKVRLIGKVPQEQAVESRLYSNLIKCGDALWLIPSRAHALAEFNLKEQSFKQYPVPYKIKYSMLHEDKIYMVSYDYRFLLTMDLRLKSISRENIGLENILDYDSIPIAGETYSDDLYLIGDKLIFIILDTNLLVSYHLIYKNATVTPIGSHDDGFGRLLHDGGRMWLIPSYTQEKITCWDGKQEWNIDESEYPDGFVHTWNFSQCTVWNGYLWLFPARGNMILKLNLLTIKIECALQWEQCFDVETVHIISEDRLLFTTSHSVMDHRIHLINPDGYEIWEQSISETDNLDLQLGLAFKRLDEEEYTSDYGYQISETREWNISALSEVLSSNPYGFKAEQNYFRSIYSNGNGTAGRSILKEMKRKIL